MVDLSIVHRARLAGCCGIHPTNGSLAIATKSSHCISIYFHDISTCRICSCDCCPAMSHCTMGASISRRRLGGGRTMNPGKRRQLYQSRKLSVSTCSTRPMKTLRRTKSIQKISSKLRDLRRYYRIPGISFSTTLMPRMRSSSMARWIATTSHRHSNLHARAAT